MSFVFFFLPYDRQKYIKKSIYLLFYFDHTTPTASKMHEVIEFQLNNDEDEEEEKVLYISFFFPINSLRNID